MKDVNWFSEEYPEVGEVVTLRLTRVDEMGVWAQLLEYGNKEGMIPLGQYTTRRGGKAPRNIAVDRLEIAIVAAVDTTKGNIDLTRQGLRTDETEQEQKRYSDYNSLMNIMKWLSDKVKVPIEKLVRSVVHVLHDRFGNAYQALQSAFRDESVIDDLETSDEVKKELKAKVKRMFAPVEMRIQALFEAEVTTMNGVDDLRASLVSGYDAAPEDVNLRLTVIAAPLYAASMVVFDDQKGVETMSKVLQTVETRILNVKGRFEIKEMPKAMNKAELEKFNQRLQELAAGDDDVDMDELDDEE